MLSIRVLSSDVDYEGLGQEQKLEITERLQLAGINALQMFSGVEAVWLAPYDKGSALNAKAFSVEVETPTMLSEKQLEELAIAILHVFQTSPDVPFGQP
ncbi:hypothetical protein M1349_04420, partial [Patescibacteria group bacterium]|nr:hypothetical protein [Patescibacteria group bacterium]